VLQHRGLIFICGKGSAQVDASGELSPQKWQASGKPKFLALGTIAVTRLLSKLHRVGLEPTTKRLRVSCSTIELAMHLQRRTGDFQIFLTSL
jgi:hypothetical protein